MHTAYRQQPIYIKKKTPEKAKGEQIPCIYSRAWIILIALSEIQTPAAATEIQHATHVTA